jgi:capsular exopolysaccharide synthesis family protein
MTNSTGATQTLSTDWSLAELLGTLRRRWILACLVALPIAVAGVWYAAVLPPQYEGEAVISLLPRPANPVGADIIRLSVPRYAVYASSDSLIRTIAGEEGVDPEDLERSLNVRMPPETGNLEIVVESDTAELAARLANAFAEETVDFSAGDRLVTAVVIAEALPALEPAGPPRLLLQSAVTILALLLGAGTAVAVERFQPRVRNDDELAAVAGVPVLGRLPRSRILTGRVEEALADASLGAAIRTLRTNVSYTPGADAVRVIGVSSALEGEGKTTVSTLLAASAAVVDFRVLLIDGDLIHPALAGKFGLDARPGLDELLRGRLDDLGAAIRPDVLRGLSVLPTAPARDAGDLVLRLHRTLEAVRQPYDLVVVDLPPVLSSDVARVAASVVDVMLVVVSQGARVGDVRHTLAALEAVNSKVLGVVANRSDSATMMYGYSGGG